MIEICGFRTACSKLMDVLAAFWIGMDDKDNSIHKKIVASQFYVKWQFANLNLG